MLSRRPNKSEARGAQPWATAIPEQHRVYPPRQLVSSRSIHFSHCPDDSAALGWLIIYLTARSLPRPECETGWALVRKWLSELVTLKHGHCRGAT
jgi:hypothetical protein